jgi:hypothetical protein
MNRERRLQGQRQETRLALEYPELIRDEEILKRDMGEHRHMRVIVVVVLVAVTVVRLDEAESTSRRELSPQLFQ